LYAHPSHNPLAVGALELANALAACCLSSRLSSQHRQWAAQQLVRTLAAHDRDNSHAQPPPLADMAGDLRKCPMVKLEAHQSRVGPGSIVYVEVLFSHYKPFRNCHVTKNCHCDEVTSRVGIVPLDVCCLEQTHNDNFRHVTILKRLVMANHPHARSPLMSSFC